MNRQWSVLGNTRNLTNGHESNSWPHPSNTLQSIYARTHTCLIAFLTGSCCPLLDSPKMDKRLTWFKANSIQGQKLITGQFDSGPKYDWVMLFLCHGLECTCFFFQERLTAHEARFMEYKAGLVDAGIRGPRSHSGPQSRSRHPAWHEMLLKML